MMVGRDVELIVPKGPAQPGDVVLSVRDLVVRDDRLEVAVDGIDLEVRAGEIVAIAGVQGNGQTELVEAITGLRQIDSGEITIGGTHVEKATPREVSDLGVAHIPEDRGRDGLVAYMSIAHSQFGKKKAQLLAAPFCSLCAADRLRAIRPPATAAARPPCCHRGDRWTAAGRTRAPRTR